MNTLSWFIYWADVLPAFARTLTLLLLLVFFVSFGVNTFLLVENGIKKYIWITLLSAFMLILTSLIPTQSTLYAIAASEMGEEVYKSEQGQKVVKQLSDWVEAQLKVSK